MPNNETKKMETRQRIDKNSKDLIKKLRHHIRERHSLCVIKAPPGSGKTYTLVNGVAYAVDKSQRIAIAAQTNAQADDLCHRILKAHPGLKVCRFAASSAEVPASLDGRVDWCTDTRSLPDDLSVVVSTTAKWSLVNLVRDFDYLFVDEAWQMAWGNFMLLQQVASRFVLIGDPGQIPPVVTIPVRRWETASKAPHRSAPELLLEDLSLPKLALDLPSCRRLPSDSVDLVRPFYDFEFDAWAHPGDRYCRSKSPKQKVSVDRVIDLLSNQSIAIATLATPHNGPPIEDDTEIAALAVDFTKRLLERKTMVASEDDRQAELLSPSDIGISATHRMLNSSIRQALPPELRDQALGIRVDTPERWQGLERKLMIVVHPLSGVVQPSAFDLETGRLCVMASRHRSGLIVLSRDHVPRMLDSYIPSAEQAIGRPDIAGRGHFQNYAFWQTLAKSNRVIPV
jgi:RecA/RadA recombinase